ncbi:kinase-like domain-containing protein [Gigaspora rosea]|uniref:Kinase-like domain-containing protein n=1 Tax=Gigaspora rosea TaxID=44941 RepID=A0A397U8U0_9GLOM|nr:kinase-like domain-containing protein [Gigaspora rosea]
MDEEVVKKVFRNELKRLNGAKHERIIELYGISLDIEKQTFYLVMEFANNGTLREYLKKNNLEWPEKIRLASQIAEGMSYLHNIDIIHRDLTTENILIHNENAKISDFGLSRNLLSMAANSHNDVVGKIPFIDSRKLEVGENYLYGKKSDTYSMGVLMWEISSNGRPPFSDDKNPVSLMKKIIKKSREAPVPGTPYQYIDLYSKCWDHEPDKRPSMKQILDQLNSLEVNPKYDDCSPG